MSILTLTQQIERPVADVFRTLAHTCDFAAWNPAIEDSRKLTPGEPHNGTRAGWRLKGSGAVTQELQEFDPNRGLRSRSG
jgi:uncharacterized protein YndB with AHSA1/START domain